MASPPTYSDALRDDDKQFVTLADCQYHASLLQTFNKLRIADPTLEKLYLARAETRYILWMNHIADTIQPDADILPPIDVVYMWHAHLLSPYRFFEDTIRNNWKALQTEAYKLPLERLDWARRTFKNGIDPISEKYWNHVYPNEPYQLTTDNIEEGGSVISCPTCLASVKSSWREYARMRTDKRVSLNCTKCMNDVNVDIISCTRFITDWKESTSVNIKLAGLAVDKIGKPLAFDIKTAQSVMDIKDSINMELVIERMSPFTWEKIISIFKKLLLVRGRRDGGARTIINIMRSRYMGIPCRTSMDLMLAVARQWDFTSKMVELDWTTPESVADAVARYKKFLMLMKDYPNSMLVPVLSIDLAWHTHMLNHYGYREYTLKTLHRVINHDDTITNATANSGLISTSKRWYKKYQEPYTTDNLERMYYQENKAAFFFPPTTIYAVVQQKKLRKAWRSASDSSKRNIQEKDQVFQHDGRAATTVFGPMVMPEFWYGNSMSASLGVAACGIGTAFGPGSSCSAGTGAACAGIMSAGGGGACATAGAGCGGGGGGGCGGGGGGCGGGGGGGGGCGGGC